MADDDGRHRGRPTGPSGPPSRSPARAAQRNKRKSSACDRRRARRCSACSRSRPCRSGSTWSTRPPTVQVPDLTGKTAAQADAALAAQELTRRRRIRRPSDDCTAGQIIDQSPKFGRGRRQGQPGRLHGVRGAGQGGGAQPGRAERRRRRAVLDRAEPQVRRRSRSTRSTRARWSTPTRRPTPCSTRATRVVLKVGNGNLIPLPDLKGLTRDEAIGKLRDAGFTNNPKFGRTPRSPTRTRTARCTEDHGPRKVGQPYNPKQRNDHGLHRQARPSPRRHRRRATSRRRRRSGTGCPALPTLRRRTRPGGGSRPRLDQRRCPVERVRSGRRPRASSPASGGRPG